MSTIPWLLVLNLTRLGVFVCVQASIARNYSITDFAAYMFILASVGFASVFYDYGFTYSSVRDISKVKLIKERKQMLLLILTCKMFNGLLCIPLLLLLTFVSNVELDVTMFVLMVFFLISNLLSPIWYFQSQDRLQFSTFIEVLSILILLPFLYIDEIRLKNIYDVVFYQSLLKLFGYIYLYFCVLKVKDIIEFFSEYKLINAISAYRNGRGTFFYKLLSSGQVSGFPLILSSLASPQYFAYFMVAEKLFRAGQGLLNPIFQILYVRTVKFEKGSREYYSSINFSMKIISIFSVVGVFLTVIIGPLIIQFLYGNDFVESSSILSALSFLYPVVSMSAVLGLQYFLVIGKDVKFNVIMLTGFFVLILSTLFIQGLGDHLFHVPLILAEIYIFIVLIVNYTREVGCKLR